MPRSITSTRVLILNLIALAVPPARSEHHDAIIDWVRSRGGFFSDKIEIRRAEPDDPNSHLGVFATKNISAKERLLEVPKSCFIALGGDEVLTASTDDDDGFYWKNVCSLSKKLMKEMELGADSDYAPYIAYVNAQKTGQIPATWSNAGKDLLRTVLDEGRNLAYGNNFLPPKNMVDWIDIHLKQAGCIDAEDPFQEHAAAITVQRGYDTALIPIWDMFNHDNNLLNTENDSMNEEFGLRVRAAEEIDEGEEIFATYNQCVDCEGISDWWGTPEILRDFGFVERYPQQWVFLGSDDMYIWFTMEKPESGSGEPVAYFWQHGKPDEEGRPNEGNILFLREQLGRLKKVSTVELKERGGVPENEWNIILQFHHAATAAISGVLKAALQRGYDEL